MSPSRSSARKKAPVPTDDASNAAVPGTEADHARRSTAGADRVPHRALLRLRRAGGLRRGVRRVGARVARAGKQLPRPDHARLADAASGRPARLHVRAGRAPGADAVARQRVQPRRPRSMGEPPRAPDAGRDPLRGRAEARRARDLAAVRERALHHRRHARRRSHRRRRDAEPAHDRRDPETALRQERSGTPRGAGRGVHAARVLRRPEPASRRSGRAAVRERAQRGRGEPASEGYVDHCDARPCGVLLSTRREARRASLAYARGNARVARRSRVSGQRSHRGVRRSRRRVCVLRPHGGAAARARLRHRRCRRQGRRSRATGGARLHIEGAALGDRVQVSARGEDDAPARHHGEHRPNRSRDTVRRARAGVRRRRERRNGNPAQRGRRHFAKTSGPATR